MEIVLNDREVRVLGCLMEKAMATPEYYPLSLNALTNACNQKSNRDPVVDWDDVTVQKALDDLEEKGLVNRSTVGRVPKYEETFTRRHNMVASEAAALCVLLLRGPQTPGAIRIRSERLYAFDSLEALQATLDRLDEWSHIRRLPRLPGHKESRYVHLLAGEPEVNGGVSQTTARVSSPERADRLAHVENEIRLLKSELADLKAAFDKIRRQFE